MAVLVSLKQKLVSKNRMFKLPKPEAVNWIELDANEWELILRKPVMTVQEFAYCSIGAMIPPRKWDGSIIEEITKSVTAKTDLELGIDWRNHGTNIHIEATELMNDFIKTVSERHDVLRNNAISGDLGVSYPNPDAPSDPYYKIKDMIEFARNNGWELPPQLSNEITQKVELATDTTPTDDASLAALFDPVPVNALEKTFPANGQWTAWAERAKRNGLKDAAKEDRGLFNPYKAAMWFVKQGINGWDLARCYRVLGNNLPARSLDSKHLFTDNPD